MLVWIDALCIDQQNRDEQAIQVRLMGHIYNPAKSVAIWLGPMSDQSELAVRLLRRVSEDAVSLEWIRSARTYQGSPALLTLFKREYWKRLWVVQEVSTRGKRWCTVATLCYHGKSTRRLQVQFGIMKAALMSAKAQAVSPT
jgi:hypothetical protein